MVSLNSVLKQSVKSIYWGKLKKRDNTILSHLEALGLVKQLMCKSETPCVTDHATFYTLLTPYPSVWSITVHTESLS